MRVLRGLEVVGFMLGIFVTMMAINLIVFVYKLMFRKPLFGCVKGWEFFSGSMAWLG